MPQVEAKLTRNATQNQKNVAFLKCYKKHLVRLSDLHYPDNYDSTSAKK